MLWGFWELRLCNILNCAIELLHLLFFKTKKKPSGTLFAEYGKNVDRPLLDNFWVTKESEMYERNQVFAKKDDLIHLKRRKYSVETFLNNNILKISQGPKGRWH